MVLPARMKLVALKFAIAQMTKESDMGAVLPLRIAPSAIIPFRLLIGEPITHQVKIPLENTWRSPLEWEYLEHLSTLRASWFPAPS